MVPMGSTCKIKGNAGTMVNWFLEVILEFGCQRGGMHAILCFILLLCYISASNCLFSGRKSNINWRRTPAKKRKMGLFILMKSFTKSIFDPTFGVDDINNDINPNHHDGKQYKRGQKKKFTGKNNKLGSTPHGSIFSGGAAGPVCGPGGCF